MGLLSSRASSSSSSRPATSHQAVVDARCLAQIMQSASLRQRVRRHVADVLPTPRLTRAALKETSETRRWSGCIQQDGKVSPPEAGEPGPHQSPTNGAETVLLRGSSADTRPDRLSALRRRTPTTDPTCLPASLSSTSPTKRQVRDPPQAIVDPLLGH